MNRQQLIGNLYADGFSPEDMPETMQRHTGAYSYHSSFRRSLRRYVSVPLSAFLLAAGPFAATAQATAASRSSSSQQSPCGRATRETVRDIMNCYEQLTENAARNYYAFSDKRDAATDVNERAKHVCEAQRYNAIVESASSSAADIMTAVGAASLDDNGSSFQRALLIDQMRYPEIQALRDKDCGYQSDVSSSSFSPISSTNRQETRSQPIQPSRSTSSPSNQPARADESSGKLVDIFDVTYSNGLVNTIYVSIDYPTSITLSQDWPVVFRAQVPDPWYERDFLHRGSLHVAIDDAAGRFERPTLRIYNMTTQQLEDPVRNIDPSFLEQQGAAYVEDQIAGFIPFANVFGILRELTPRQQLMPTAFLDDATYDRLWAPFIGWTLPFDQREQRANGVEMTVPIVWDTSPTHNIHLYFESFVGPQEENRAETPEISRPYTLVVHPDGRVHAERERPQ